MPVKMSESVLFRFVWTASLLTDALVSLHRQADLEAMEMRKPFMGALRRTYHPALWLQYRQSDHHTLVDLRIHRLQVRRSS